MTDKMKYIITETQYKKLINERKVKKVANQIKEEVDKLKLNLNENIVKNAISDKLKLYSKKGMLTNSVVEQLKESLSDELINAGIIKK